MDPQTPQDPRTRQRAAGRRRGVARGPQARENCAQVSPGELAGKCKIKRGGRKLRFASDLLGSSLFAESAVSAPPVSLLPFGCVLWYSQAMRRESDIVKSPTSRPILRGFLVLVRNSRVLGVLARKRCGGHDACFSKDPSNKNRKQHARSTVPPSACPPLVAWFAGLAGFAGPLSQLPCSVRDVRVLRGLRVHLVSFLVGFAGRAGFAVPLSQIPCRFSSRVRGLRVLIDMRHAAPWKRAVPVDNLWITCGKPASRVASILQFIHNPPPLIHHLSTAYPQLIHRQNRDLQRIQKGSKSTVHCFPIMR